METAPAVAVATEAPQAPVLEPTATLEPIITPEPEATVTTEPTATTAPDPTEEPVAATGPIVFEIVQDESEARFIIDEVLRGSPKTVVGVTNQVAGQIAVDPADPASAQVGQISINARTLACAPTARRAGVVYKCPSRSGPRP